MCLNFLWPNLYENNFVHIARRQKELTSASQSWPEKDVFVCFDFPLLFSNFFQRLCFFRLLFLFNLFLYFLFIIITSPINTFPIILGFAMSILVLLLNFDMFLLDSHDLFVLFLFLDFFLEKLAKVIVLFILLISIINIHKAVRFISHVIPQSLAIGKVLCSFIIA